MPGEQTLAGVFNLRPAQTYHIRIVAENEIGSSEPSDTVTILTAEEGTLQNKTQDICGNMGTFCPRVQQTKQRRPRK